MASLLSKPKSEPAKEQSRPRMVHLMQRVFNAPLMIHRAKLDVILRAIGPKLGVNPAMYADEAWPPTEKREKPEQSGPVAVIPVYGSLVKRGGYMDSMSGLTSYESIRNNVQDAMNDSSVKALLFDIDSPGGEAAGLFDFADYLMGLRGSKPMIGISNDMAYSAAYAIASTMDKLYVTGVGGVGSIGVYMLHVDQSEMDKQDGLKYTYVKSGDKKADGNPHEPLDKSTKNEMQDQVDKIRDMFVSLVAKGRGVDAKKIYDTEAAQYMGTDAIPMLADGVCCYDEAMDYALSGAKAKRSVVIPHKAPVIDANSHMLHDGERVEVQADGRLLMKRDHGTSLYLVRAGVGIAPPYGRISGILAPYDVLSCDLGGFKEIYKPGCFKKSLETGDPLVLAYHDPSKVLGRKSAGTARFWEAADGLHYEADLPDTQDAQDLKKSIERGDVRGASAAFFIEKYKWETRGGDRVRVVEQAELVEGSPHSFAAYSDTTADAEQAAAAAHDELIGVRLRLLKQ